MEGGALSANALGLTLSRAADTMKKWPLRSHNRKLPPRSTAGQLTLDQHIGVRIPGGQPSYLESAALRMFFNAAIEFLYFFYLIDSVGTGMLLDDLTKNQHIGLRLIERRVKSAAYRAVHLP
jgi:hypothetical protein